MQVAGIGAVSVGLCSFLMIIKNKVKNTILWILHECVGDSWWRFAAKSRKLFKSPATRLRKHFNHTLDDQQKAEIREAAVLSGGG